MSTIRRAAIGFSIAAVTAIASACGSSPAPTRPSTQPLPASGRIEGEWRGATSQGSPITFVVSADETVTSLSVGYTFNGCSGTHTFDNLSVPIVTHHYEPPEGPMDVRFFAYGPSDTAGPRSVTAVTGYFSLPGTAFGFVQFVRYAGCGDGDTIWTATKR